jgi:hypothetical protein
MRWSIQAISKEYFQLIKIDRPDRRVDGPGGKFRDVTILGAATEMRRRVG